MVLTICRMNGAGTMVTWEPRNLAADTLREAAERQVARLRAQHEHAVTLIGEDGKDFPIVHLVLYRFADLGVVEMALGPGTGEVGILGSLNGERRGPLITLHSPSAEDLDEALARQVALLG